MLGGGSPRRTHLGSEPETEKPPMRIKTPLGAHKPPMLVPRRSPPMWLLDWGADTPQLHLCPGSPRPPQGFTGRDGAAPKLRTGDTALGMGLTTNATGTGTDPPSPQHTAWHFCRLHRPPETGSERATFQEAKMDRAPSPDERGLIATFLGRWGRHAGVPPKRSRGCTGGLLPA